MIGVEALAKRAEGARPDVAVDDAEGSERERWASLVRRLLGGLALALGLLLACGAIADDTLGRAMPDEGAAHIPPGTAGMYAHYPPASGPHWPSPAEWGMYGEPVRPEMWVHNLEHGGVVILYRCDRPCPQLVQDLRKVYETFPRGKYGVVKLVIAPDARIPTRLAILAWHWLDEMPAFDRDRLLRFYRAHLDRGPEDVP